MKLSVPGYWLPAVFNNQQSVTTILLRTNYSELESNLSLIRVIPWAFPVPGSMEITAPSRTIPLLATSNLFGMWVKNRSMAISFFTPITESTGPVIPASVIYAVP